MLLLPAICKTHLIIPMQEHFLEVSQSKQVYCVTIQSRDLCTTAGVLLKLLLHSSNISAHVFDFF